MLGGALGSVLGLSSLTMEGSRWLWPMRITQCFITPVSREPLSRSSATSCETCLNLTSLLLKEKQEMAVYQMLCVTTPEVSTIIKYGFTEDRRDGLRG